MPYPVVPAVPTGTVTIVNTINDSTGVNKLVVNADGSVNVKNELVNNDGITLIAYAGLNANADSGDQSNAGYRGVVLFVKTAAFAGAPGAVTLVLQAKDMIASAYTTIWTSPTITSGSAFFAWPICPGVTNSTVLATAAQSLGLPAHWRVGVRCADWKGGAATVNIGVFASLIA